MVCALCMATGQGSEADRMGVYVGPQWPLTKDPGVEKAWQQKAQACNHAGVGGSDSLPARMPPAPQAPPADECLRGLALRHRRHTAWRRTQLAPLATQAQLCYPHPVSHQGRIGADGVGGQFGLSIAGARASYSQGLTPLMMVGLTIHCLCQLDQGSVQLPLVSVPLCQCGALERLGLSHYSLCDTGICMAAMKTFG